MVDRERWLAGVTVAGVSLAAGLVYFFLVSDALPFGPDMALAAEGVFGAGDDVPPVWGALLRLAWAVLPGEPAFRLGVVSALAGAVAVGAVACAVRRAFGRAVAFFGEDGRLARVFPHLAAVAAAVFVASVSDVFAGATKAGPFAVQLALAGLAAAFACGGDIVEEPRAAGRIRAAATGLACGLAALEGLPGVVALPFVFALAAFGATRRWALRPTVFVALFALGLALAVGMDALLGWTVPTVLPRVRPGVIWLFLAGVVVSAQCVSVRRRGVTADACAVLVAALAVAGIQARICAQGRGDGRAADAYVRELVDRLDGRRWLVSDGAFDALVRFYLPEGTHLVTYARAGDRTHGEEIGRWVCEEVPDAGDDLLLVADLGPSRFVEAWLARPGAATNCVFATVFEPPGDARSGRRVAPLGFCWRTEPADVDAASAEAAWRAAWARMEPFLGRKDPAADLVRRRFAAHGNAVGSLLQEAGLTNRAWAAYAFARKEMDKRNLSLLLNMDEMARRGLAGGDLVASLVAKVVVTELSDIGDLTVLRRRLAEGGRLFVPEDVRRLLAESVRTRRAAFWATPSGELLRAGLGRLKAAERLEGAARAKELDAIAKAVAPALGDRTVAAWVKDLFRGQLAQLRGRAGLAEAQRRYRAVVDRGEGDFHLAFDRLLAVDLALGDGDALENDALRVLRLDSGHALANALAGSARLVRGESASALRFLRSAERMGLASPAVLNDLALALARSGRREEAREMIRRARAAAPDNAHLRATESEIGER